MLDEYKDVVSKLKNSNARFAKLFAKHNELDLKITDATKRREHVDSIVLDTLKKQKLKIKDEIYAMCMAHKRAHG